jgi:hypothetical protein
MPKKILVAIRLKVAPSVAVCHCFLGGSAVAGGLDQPEEGERDTCRQSHEQEPRRAVRPAIEQVTRAPEQYDRANEPVAGEHDRLVARLVPLLRFIRVRDEPMLGHGQVPLLYKESHASVILDGSFGPLDVSMNWRVTCHPSIRYSRRAATAPSTTFASAIVRDTQEVRVVARVPSVHSVQSCETSNDVQRLVVVTRDRVPHRRHHIDGIDVVSRRTSRSDHVAP